MKKDTAKKVVRKEFEIKPLSDDFVMPVKAKRGSIGYDLTVPHDIVIPAHSRTKVPLDFAINLPAGTEAKIAPRSGCSLNGIVGYGVRKVRKKFLGIIPYVGKVSGRMCFDADVMVGKIDPNYTDNVHVLIKNHGEKFLLRAGTRIAQMTFYYTTSPFFKVVNELSAKSRGGGFGSSGTGKIDRYHKDMQRGADSAPNETEAAPNQHDEPSTESEAAPSNE